MLWLGWAGRTPTAPCDESFGRHAPPCHATAPVTPVMIPRNDGTALNIRLKIWGLSAAAAGPAFFAMALPKASQPGAACAAGTSAGFGFFEASLATSASERAGGGLAPAASPPSLSATAGSGPEAPRSLRLARSFDPEVWLLAPCCDGRAREGKTTSECSKRRARRENGIPIPDAPRWENTPYRQIKESPGW